MTEYLCTSLGYSKQAYYKSLRSCNDKEERERYVLSIVEELRRDLPRLGVYKLWRMLNDNGLPVGRDWLFRLLHRHDLLVKMKKYRVVTTDSRAWRHQYPNLVKGYCVERANQVWVSDITYLVTGKGVVYLSLVTDAYSRRIMGWEVYPTLDSAGPVKRPVALHARKDLLRAHLLPILQMPGVGIMAVQAAHGTSLKEHHKADSRSIHSSKAFHRMNFSHKVLLFDPIHLIFIMQSREPAYPGVPAAKAAGHRFRFARFILSVSLPHELHALVEGSCNDFVLLLFGQLDKVYRISGNTDRELRILLRVFLCI